MLVRMWQRRVRGSACRRACEVHGAPFAAHAATAARAPSAAPSAAPERSGRPLYLPPLEHEPEELYRCVGCGVRLQSRAPDGAGFIPRRILAEVDATLSGRAAGGDTRLICQRCFRMKHYGHLVPPTLPYASFREQVRSALAGRDVAVVVVVDVFDFGGSVVRNLHDDLLRSRPAEDVIFAVNKCDLLPPATRFDRLHAWLRQQLRATGQLPAEAKEEVDGLEERERERPQRQKQQKGPEVVCVSARTLEGVKDLVARLEAVRKGRDVVVMGAANVGKSSLVNALVNEMWLGPELARRGALPKRGERALEASKLPKRAFVLDKPPPGYKLGDVFAGDLDALAAQERAEQRQRMEQAQKEAEEGDPGSPVPRFRVADASGRNLANLRVAEVSLSAPPGADQAAAEPEDTAPAAAGSETATRYSRQGKEITRSGNAKAGTADKAPRALQSALEMLQASSASGGDQVRAFIPLTTSPLPGTTLGVVGAPLSTKDGSRLWDTPGIVDDEEKQRLLERIAAGVVGAAGGDLEEGEAERRLLERRLSVLRQVLPQQRFRPVTYRVSAGETIFVGGLARVDVDHRFRDASLLLTWFGALPTHLTSTARAPELEQRHIVGAYDDPARFPAQLATSPTTLLPALLGASSNPRAPDVLRPCAGPLDRDAGVFFPRELEPKVRSHLGEPPAGGNPERTRWRRQHRERRGIADLVFSGLGWLMFTPVDIEGMFGWERSIAFTALRVTTVAGVHVHMRPPMLPFETSGTTPRDWVAH